MPTRAHQHRLRLEVVERRPILSAAGCTAGPPVLVRPSDTARIGAGGLAPMVAQGSGWTSATGPEGDARAVHGLTPAEGSERVPLSLASAVIDPSESGGPSAATADGTMAITWLWKIQTI